jgi:hypothetical protein
MTVTEDRSSPIQRALSRRALIGGGAAAAGALAAVTSPLAQTATAGASTVLSPQHGGGRRRGAGDSALGFTAIAPNTADAVTVPPGYVAQVLIPWGDPIQPDGPAFKFDATNTAAEQAQQFGMSHDGMALFPLSRNRVLLAMNHEAVDSPAILFPSAPDYTNPETVLKGQNVHGVSISELELRSGTWRRVKSKYARRITPNTPMELTGPAAGHPLLQTAADPSGRRSLGTVNNCANGKTPLGDLPHLRGELQPVLRHDGDVHAHRTASALRRRQRRQPLVAR